MAVDCHFHVIAPADRFAMHPARSYTPAVASLDDWRATLGPRGITHGVLVQPSIYGTDNGALLAALAEAHGQLVGVGAVNGAISDAELDAMVDAGVRGLRFAHFEPRDSRMMPGFVALDELAGLAPRLRERNLHIDLFTDSRLLSGIAPILRQARVPVVLDHMGRTPAMLGTDHRGMAPLRAVLEEGWCWVKLSGLANVSSQAPLYGDARPMHDWLVDGFAHRLVWGSDWPHTRPQGNAPATRVLFDRFQVWTPSADIRQMILVDNPRTLYRLS